jgi:hypothetical protein
MLKIFNRVLPCFSVTFCNIILTWNIVDISTNNISQGHYIMPFMPQFTTLVYLMTYTHDSSHQFISNASFWFPQLGFAAATLLLVPMAGLLAVTPSVHGWASRS